MLKKKTLNGNLQNLKLISNQIIPRQQINNKFTPLGNDINPEFSWVDTPINTKSFAFLVDDPDAPNGLFNHWCLINIPKETTKISENSIPKNSIEIENSWGIKKYKGPKPPNHQLHNYHFKIYALDSEFEFNPNTDITLNYVRQFIIDHTIGMSEIIAPYQN